MKQVDIDDVPSTWIDKAFTNDRSVWWFDIINWCENQPGSGKFVGPQYADTGSSVWYFEDPADALMFTLKWCSQ